MYWQPSELFGSDVYFVLFFSGRQKIASFSVTDLNTIRDVRAPAERSDEPSQSINTHAHIAANLSISRPCRFLLDSLIVIKWHFGADESGYVIIRVPAVNEALLYAPARVRRGSVILHL